MAVNVSSNKKGQYLCLNCHKKIIRWICTVKDESKVFCSITCHNKLMNKNRDQTGSNNPNWKGGEEYYKKRARKRYYDKRIPRILSNSYGAIHKWIKRRKKKIKLCECCNFKNSQDLANISQEYKRDISDWEWLCRSCHMRKDGRLKKLIGNHKRRPKNNDNA